MSDNLRKLFVYGTLKKGQPSHYMLLNKSNGHANFIGTATTTVKLPLIVGSQFNIPFLINKPGFSNYVKGEIYEIDDKMLETLDKFEDYPKSYDREIFEMNLGTGEVSLPCWVYILNKYPEKLLKYQTFSEYTDREDCKYIESDAGFEEYIFDDISKHN